MDHSTWWNSVPTSLLAEGCWDCYLGWGHTHELLYRCSCNPGTPHYVDLREIYPDGPQEPGIPVT